MIEGTPKSEEGALRGRAIAQLKGQCPEERPQWSIGKE